MLGMGRHHQPTQCSTALRGELPGDAMHVVETHRPDLVLHLASPIALEPDDATQLRAGIVDVNRLSFRPFFSRWNFFSVAGVAFGKPLPVFC